MSRVLDQACHELGTSAWEAAIAEGRTLTVADALASAEEWTRSPLERSGGAEPAPGKHDASPALVERSLPM